MAVLRRQPQEASKRADALVQAAPDDGLVLNNMAWLKYTEGVDLATARDDAHRALELRPKDGFIANTSAALDAEAGDLGTAADEIRKSVELGHHDVPSDADWYVLGRIYELSGLRDDAVEAYRRVPAPKTPELFPGSFTLASARLKALGAAKK